MKIYHNPRCSKSREALELLKDKGQEPEIVLYLQATPTQKDLKALLKQLGLKAEQLLRKKEPIFKDQFKGKTLTEAQWIKAMVQFPKLIERPIVIKGNKAVVGRPVENILELL